MSAGSGSAAARGESAGAAVLDAAAERLRAAAPVFTTRNLFFATCRVRGGAMSEAAFDAALKARLARGPIAGLLPARPGRSLAGDEAVSVVLLVDRPAILELCLALARAGASELRGLAVVCIDGSPAPVVARLVKRIRAGAGGGHHRDRWRPPVLYLHDAATVVYPFAIEPLATLVACVGDAPVVYRDLGLPPLGAAARRFGDPTLPRDEAVLHLEAIPTGTLARYCARSVAALGEERAS
jgi:hypothetical protein